MLWMSQECTKQSTFVMQVYLCIDKFPLLSQEIKSASRLNLRERE